MTVLQNTTRIGCPPELAFGYLGDLRNELEWNPGVQSVQKITDGPVSRGTKFMAKWKQSKLIEVECVEFDRPNRSWAYLNGGPVSVRFEGRVEPDGDGCRFYANFDARPNGLFKLVFPIFIRVMKRQEKANMVNLRKALEAKVGAQGSSS